MKQDIVLRTIGMLMQWDDEAARKEFAWLKLMSRMKYDDYQEFLAGMRFVESLADWLQQFEQDERIYAYEFIRTHLVFFSEAEMRHLAELLFSETVEPILVNRASGRTKVPSYLVWADETANRTFALLLRKTIFVELSDGARLDVFRRANEGRVSNEQVITAPRINKNKWDEMLKELREDLGDPDAKFESVVLVDDFTASGTTLFRFNEEKGEWKGKLKKFWDDINKEGVIESHFEDGWQLIVHHYITTSQAHDAIAERHAKKIETLGDEKWFENVEFTYGTVLPPEFKVIPGEIQEFAELVTKYYDSAIETHHTDVGGEGARWGFGGCSLPLVLEHNTPNNTIALLWAESQGGNEMHSMRPLFRRRQRHL